MSLVNCKEHFIELNIPHFLGDVRLPLNEFLNSRFLGCRYAYICHDKDVNEDGEQIRPHYHLVVLGSKRFKTEAFIREFQDWLICDYKAKLCNELYEQVPNCIRDGDCNSVYACVSYLIHQDKVDKHQYDITEMVVSDDGMYRYLENHEYDENELLEIILKAKTYLELVQIIGIDKAEKYKGVISKLRWMKDNMRRVDLLENVQASKKIGE